MYIYFRLLTNFYLYPSLLEDACRRLTKIRKTTFQAIRPRRSYLMRRYSGPCLITYPSLVHQECPCPSNFQCSRITIDVSPTHCLHVLRRNQETRDNDLCRYVPGTSTCFHVNRTCCDESLRDK